MNDEGDEGATHPWERNFRQSLVRLRKSVGLNQTDLARQVNERGFPFHQQTIQRIEAGDRPVRLNEAHVIAEVLGSSLEAMASDAPPDVQAVVGAIEAARRRAGTDSKLLADALERVYIATVAAVDDLARAAGSIDNEVGQWAFAWIQRSWDAVGALDSACAAVTELAENETFARLLDVTDDLDRFHKLAKQHGWEEYVQELPTSPPRPDRDAT